MTMKHVAERARVHPASISLMERDAHGIGFFNIIEIARVLDVSLDYIAYGDSHGN